jgi:hypothetical protein
MSRWLSPRLVELRSLQATGPIDRDVYCFSCGYNVRGLNYGRACPECGSTISPASARVGGVLAGSDRQRRQWETGLGLGVLCLTVVIVARVLLFAISPFVGTGLRGPYVVVGAITAVLWVRAAWLMTPPELDDVWPERRTLRGTARRLQWLWLVAYTALLAEHFLAATGPVGETLRMIAQATRLLAGCGVVLLAYLLRRVAESAELESAANRFNAFVWFIWLPALLMQVFPTMMPWIALILTAFVLALWIWVMLLLLLGTLELHRHLRWLRIHAVEAGRRAERMQETRREMDEAVEATIRPLPAERGGEIPLDPSQGGDATDPPAPAGSIDL